jgi:glycosyltransferase involved in cell wall biosynthesis
VENDYSGFGQPRRAQIDQSEMHAQRVGSPQINNMLRGNSDVTRHHRSTLVVLPSVPVVLSETTVFADAKMVEGAALYAKLWGGPVLFLARNGDPRSLAFGQHYSRAALPFRIEVIADDAHDVTGWLADAAVVLASGDNFQDFGVVRYTSAPTVYVIEYTLETRLQMIKLEQGYSFQAIKSAAWTVFSESERRKAFRASAGVQANGQPAFAAYAKFANASMRYFDTRMAADQQVSEGEVAAKKQAILRHQALRLAFSGRLEAIKGADHLVPIAKALSARGVNYTLDIFGDGSLRSNIQTAISNAGLHDQVKLHGALRFHDELVPYLKAKIDLFVCPHMQGDPSCTYLETLSCGVPIVGYSNPAFMGVLDLGKAGIAAQMGNPAGAAEAIQVLDSHRAQLAELVDTAAAVGRENSFEQTFAARIDHLKRVALLASDNQAHAA